jgi:hypothetical protein
LNRNEKLYKEIFGCWHQFCHVLWRRRSMDNKKSNIKKGFAILSILAMALIIVLFIAYLPAVAQNEHPGGPGMGVGGFVDEDGDGFNDLLPDSDGDGVPDAIDPDSRGQHSDSLLIHQHGQDRGDSTGMGHRMMGDSLHLGGMHDHDGPHNGFDQGPFPGMPGMPGMPGQLPGEPGQYGPGDSTGHGGMHDGHRGDGDHHGGWPPPPPPPPDSGGMRGGKVAPSSGTIGGDHSSPAVNLEPLPSQRGGAISTDRGKTNPGQTK